MRKKVLLGHLNSNGDCLFATVIARQIKEIDYPDCHLTWAVNSKCRQSILLNPYVDDIWEIPTESTLTSLDEWNMFVSSVEEKKNSGEFDHVFLTQLFGETWLNFDGGIRSSTYNNYPHKITVPLRPIIRLSDKEVANVEKFAKDNQLADYKFVILVECGPDSFDTDLNPQSAVEIARRISREHENVAIILSSSKMIATPDSNIVDASVLTFRENAELTKYCDLFIGCASGISWLATSDWAKNLNTILVIKEDVRPFTSMVYDHQFFDLPTDRIIEVKSNPGTPKTLAKCVSMVLDKNFDIAKKNFHERIALSDYFFLDDQLTVTLSKLKLRKAMSCLRRLFKRNGLRPILAADFRRIIFGLPIKVIYRFLRELGLRKRKELTAQHK